MLCDLGAFRSKVVGKKKKANRMEDDAILLHLCDSIFYRSRLLKRLEKKGRLRMATLGNRGLFAHKESTGPLRRSSRPILVWRET